MDGDTRRADLVPQASGGGSESPPPERLPHSADPDIEPAFQDDGGGLYCRSFRRRQPGTGNQGKSIRTGEKHVQNHLNRKYERRGGLWKVSCYEKLDLRTYVTSPFTGPCTFHNSKHANILSEIDKLK